MKNANQKTEQAVPTVNEFESSVAKVRAEKKRRSSDLVPPTIDNVRELLLGDTIKQSKQEMATIERKTHDQLGDLRVELGDRIDRVVRALSTVNQAVHKELNAREQSVQDSADELTSKMEERISFLEAKIYTVVGDMERKVSDHQLADYDKLVADMAEANKATEARFAELTEKMERQLDSFGERISKEIAAVNADVRAAQTESGDKFSAFNGEVDGKLGSIETRMEDELAGMRTDLSRTSVDLRSELTAQTSTQKGLLARTEADMQAKLRDHIDGIDGRKVSRTDFSTLLHELAARIDEEGSSE